MDMKEMSAMTEASGLTNNDGGIEQASLARPSRPADPSRRPSHSQDAAMRWAEQLREMTLKAPVQSLFAGVSAWALGRASALSAPFLGTGNLAMPKAAIFDLDGTLLDSVDLHALAWQEAMVEFGHDVTFEQARSQIGKGGDKLIPVFLSEAEQRDHGKTLDEWRRKRFKSAYLPLVRPFSAVPDLLRRARGAGLRIAIASSAKKDELEKYLAIAESSVWWTSRPRPKTSTSPSRHPDIFDVVLEKLGIEGGAAVAIGDTPYDAIAAGKAGIPTIGVLCGGFTESSLREAGCVEVYPGPSTIYARFDDTALAK